MTDKVRIDTVDAHKSNETYLPVRPNLNLTSGVIRANCL